MKYKPKTLRTWQVRRFIFKAILILAALIIAMCIIFGIAEN